MVNATIALIQINSCVRFFVGANRDGDYIMVTTNSTQQCESIVGYARKAGQILNLGKNCKDFGGALHELMHVLGFFHQHQAPGSEKFISVERKNLRKEHLWAYEVYSDKDVTDLGFKKYDYSSITHYGSFENTINKERVITVNEKKAGEGVGAGHLGQRIGLSSSDKAKLNTLFDCPISEYPRQI